VAPTQYQGAFREAVCRAALAAMQSVACTPQDSQMLRDMRRDDGRHQFRRVDRMIDLLATLPDDSPALTFCEDIRGPIAARRTRNEIRDIRTAALDEHALQCVADPLQLAVAFTPRPELSLVRDAIDATMRHKRGLERLLDDLFGVRFGLAHGGK
jgi:hypothetical protein